MFARLFNSLSAAALLLQLAACTAPSPRDSAVGSESTSAADRETVAAIRAAARPLTGSPSDHDPLIARAATASRILLGESTHGTHEYYADRGRLTLRLIRDAGVNAIAIEGDWTPTRRVDLYVRGLGSDRSAEQALRDYTRFPHWMWPNRTFRDFLEQLRAYNLTQPAERRVGVYGMDVYDLYDAIREVEEYLARVNGAAFEEVRRNYRCFSAYNRNNHTYGVAAGNPKRSCREEAASVVARVRFRHLLDWRRRTSISARCKQPSRSLRPRLISGPPTAAQTPGTSGTGAWPARSRRSRAMCSDGAGVPERW
jgi:erythromycin esterase-like protein